MIVDNNFNSGSVHFQVFTERATLTHEHPASVAQGAIKGRDDVGLAFPFRTGPVVEAR